METGHTGDVERGQRFRDGHPNAASFRREVECGGPPILRARLPDLGTHGPSGRTPHPNLMGHLALCREIGRLRPDHPLSVESVRAVYLGDVSTPSLGSRRRSTVAHTDTASRTTANTARPTTLTPVAMRS